LNVEQSFKNVIGRDMTPEETTRYLKFQKEFEIPDTDPTWIMFVWFQFYQDIFEKMPGTMRSEATILTGKLRDAAAEVARSTSTLIAQDQEQARDTIREEVERGKTAMAKALESTLPLKLGEALTVLEGTIEKEKSSKGLVLFTVSVALISLIISGWFLYGIAEVNGERNLSNKILQQRGG